MEAIALRKLILDENRHRINLGCKFSDILKSINESDQGGLLFYGLKGAFATFSAGLFVFKKTLYSFPLHAPRDDYVKKTIIARKKIK